MSAINTKDFYDFLLANQLDFFCGVPDSLLKNFCACVSSNSPRDKQFITANEGNAIGMACGYHLATGKYGVVYMQNSGEGNVVNPLLSLAAPEVYSIPMLLVIGWRGEPGVHDEPQHVKQGMVTLDLLKTMGIEYRVLDDGWQSQIEECLELLAQGNVVALVVKKGVFSEYAFEKQPSNAPLSREEALDTIVNHFTENDFVVATTGKTSRELFEIRERLHQGHDNDFLTVGGMGHTSSIALGVSLNTDANVWCIDGDGSFLMHMGAIPIVAQNATDNFKYILNNNCAHESVGGQPTIAGHIDIPAILKASGFSCVLEARTVDEISDAMHKLSEGGKGALVLSTHQGSRVDLGRPTVSPEDNKKALMKKISAMNGANS